MQEKVIEVPREPYRTGFSKKTKKDWSIYKVTTETGKTATVFAPIKEGDMVDLTNDEKYGWQGKVSKPPVSIDLEPILEPLRALYVQAEMIAKKVDQLLANDQELIVKPTRNWKSVGQSEPAPEEPEDDYYKQLSE